MIGIITVGLYSNYLLILNTINSFISTIVNNVLASFGNLIVKESSKKSENVFKELRLFSYFILLLLFGLVKIFYFLCSLFILYQSIIISLE